MIITAGGKNIAPRHIEGLLADHGLVRDVMVVGDGKKFLTALFTFSREGLVEQAGDDESRWQADETRAAAVARLEKHVDSVNGQLARAEQIKRFSVLGSPFTEATGELTPTRKLRRSFVCQKYASVIDRLYLDGDERHTGFVPTEDHTAEHN
jgi:long-chain acyl-CoA synthetase